MILLYVVLFFRYLGTVSLSWGYVATYLGLMGLLQYLYTYVYQGFNAANQIFRCKSLFLNLLIWTLYVDYSMLGLRGVDMGWSR